jgi:hypothetical protein
MKIYISGKMSGIENNNREAFFEAEEKLKANGYKVINPARIPEVKNGSWEYYMKEAIKLMMDADCIYLMNNWIDSKGATIEKELAEKLGMQIILENEIKME